MQKVRIISASIGDAKLIAEQLRRRGFSVEITTPGEPRLADVDFEIELGLWEEAVHQATERACEQHADDVDGASILLSRPGIADTVNGIAAGLQNKRDLMARALREERALLRQERAVQRERAHLAAKQNEFERAEKELTRSEAESQRIAEEQRRIWVQEREEAIREQIIARERAEVARGFHAHSMEEIPRVVSPRTRQWRVSFAIAGICAVILTVGWAAALRRPTLPGALFSASKPLERAATFGAHTRKPESVVQRQLVQALAVPKGDSGSAQTSDGAQKSASQRRVAPRHRSVREGDDMIAEDEIVHVSAKYPRTVEQRPSAPQRASLRRYSDMH